LGGIGNSQENKGELKRVSIRSEGRTLEGPPPLGALGGALVEGRPPIILPEEGPGPP